MPWPVSVQHGTAPLTFTKALAIPCAVKWRAGILVSAVGSVGLPLIVLLSTGSNRQMKSDFKSTCVARSL